MLGSKIQKHWHCRFPDHLFLMTMNIRTINRLVSRWEPSIGCCIVGHESDGQLICFWQEEGRTFWTPTIFAGRRTIDYLHEVVFATVHTTPSFQWKGGEDKMNSFPWCYRDSGRAIQIVFVWCWISGWGDCAVWCSQVSITAVFTWQFYIHISVWREIFKAYQSMKINSGGQGTL